MASTLYCALLHYPVRDRAGETVTTAVTTLDVHDIARSARTYGVARYYVVTPIEAQHKLIERILSHWSEGAGRRRMPERNEALSIVEARESLQAVVADIEEREGRRPSLVATAAAPRPRASSIGFGALRQRFEVEGSFLILFGTGHGLSDEVVAKADYLLHPVEGVDGYNHLSVRSAAAIILDRLRGRPTGAER